MSVSSSSYLFTWTSHDEMDETYGNGDAQLEDDNTLTGDIHFHFGDESSFMPSAGNFCEAC